MRLSKKSAVGIFKEEIEAYKISTGTTVTKDTLIEAWDNYTQSLYSSLWLTEKQYNTWVNPFK
jgi:hypothetical protein